MTPRREDAIAAELRWYWADATGDMGLKSNFEAMRARMQRAASRGGKPNVDIDERCVEAATREKHIRRALAQVPDREAVILVHAFGPGIREIPVFGPATGVVPLTRVARQAWAKSGTTRTLEDWLARLLLRVHTGRGHDPAGDAALLRAIRLEAQGTLRSAMKAYGALRRGPKVDDAAMVARNNQSRLDAPAKALAIEVR
jgi:hypothetical protein